MNPTNPTNEPILLKVRFPTPDPHRPVVPQPHWNLFVDELPESPPFLTLGPSFTLAVERPERAEVADTGPLRFEVVLDQGDPEGGADRGARGGIRLEERSRLLVHTVPRGCNVPDLVSVAFEPIGDGPARRAILSLDHHRFARFPNLLWSRFVVSLRVRVPRQDGRFHSVALPIGFQMFMARERRELAGRLAAATRAQGEGEPLPARPSALSGASLAGGEDGRLKLQVEPVPGGPPRFPNLFRPPSWNLPALSVEPLLCFTRAGVGLHLELALPPDHAFGETVGGTLDPRLPGSPRALALRWQGVSHAKLAQEPEDGTVLGHRVPDVGLTGSGTDGRTAEIAWYEAPALEVPRVASFFFSVTGKDDSLHLVDPTVMNDPPEDPDPTLPPVADDEGA